MIKSGLYRPRRLVSLRKVAPGLADIGVGPDGALEIGAMVRLSELQRSAVIRDFAPLIAETLRTHSNEQPQSFGERARLFQFERGHRRAFLDCGFPSASADYRPLAETAKRPMWGLRDKTRDNGSVSKSYFSAPAGTATRQ